MNNINNKSKDFMTVRIGLEDLLKTNDNVVAYLLASLGVYFLNKAAPNLAEQISDDKTITKWAFANGEFLYAIGKKGANPESIKQAISESIGKFKMVNIC